MSNDTNVSATILCKACNGEIPKAAKKCKHCGTDLRNWFIRHWILTIFGVLLLIGGAGVSDGDNTASHSAGDVSVSQSDTQKEPSLRVKNWNWTTKYGFMRVTGEVENTTKAPIKRLMVVAKYYDADENFVKSSESMVEYQPLLAGQVSPFTTMDTVNPAIKSVKIEFKKMFGGQVEHTE